MILLDHVNLEILSSPWTLVENWRVVMVDPTFAEFFLPYFREWWKQIQARNTSNLWILIWVIEIIFN